MAKKGVKITILTEGEIGEPEVLVHFPHLKHIAF
jgi:hypothetical protein